MKTNQAGIDLIKQFEGCSLEAYPDPGTGGEPWTIGVGHAVGVKKGDKITQAQADDLLRQDLERFEAGVAKLAQKCTPNQFSALVAFAFNCGLGNLAASTLLKKHNAGDYAGAAAEFGKWNKANKVIMLGLTRRRKAEVDLYLL